MVVRMADTLAMHGLTQHRLVIFAFLQATARLHETIADATALSQYSDLLGGNLLTSRDMMDS